MNKNYRAGYLAEQAIRKRFPAPRYITMRTAGSHGPFDVIVIDQEDPRVHLIQAKKRKRWSNAEFKKIMRELEEITVPIGCTKEIWTKLPRQDWMAHKVE